MKARHYYVRPNRDSFSPADSVINQAQPLSRHDSDRENVAERDRRIGDAALTAIHWLTTIPDEQIYIAVDAGDVTLNGTVRDLNQKRLVAQIVGEQPGVQRIRNRLRITEQLERRVFFPVSASAAHTQLRRFNELYEGSD